MIKVYVSRFNRETDTEPHMECYEIEETPHMKVLDALQAINDKYDAESYADASRQAVLDMKEDLKNAFVRG